MFCTFSSCSDLGIYLSYNIYNFQKNQRTFCRHSLSLHFTFTSQPAGRKSIAGKDTRAWGLAPSDLLLSSLSLSLHFQSLTFTHNHFHNQALRGLLTRLPQYIFDYIVTVSLFGPASNLHHPAQNGNILFNRIWRSNHGRHTSRDLHYVSGNVGEVVYGSTFVVLVI